MSGMDMRELNAVERRAFHVLRLGAYERMPYYASALFALQPVAAPGLQTFAVDKSWRVYMDPDMLTGGWSIPEGSGVLLHELGHLLRDHPQRALMLPHPYRHAAWNAAGDAEINDDLLDAGVPLPEGVITPEAFGCQSHGLAEDYYAALTDNDDPDDASGRAEPSGGDGGGTAEELCDDDAPGCGSGAGGKAVPGEWVAGAEVGGQKGVDSATGDLIRRRVAEAVETAASDGGNGRGTVPAGVRRWAEGVLAPAVVPWQRLLNRVMRNAVAEASGRTDYSYLRPSRRRIPNVVLPSMRGPKLRVAVVIDTSGSMSADDLLAAKAEVAGVLRATGLSGDRITTLTCDAETGAPQKVGRVQDIILTGGGGTDMRVGIAAADSLNPPVQVTVILTDGGTPWPATPPRSKMVCVIIGNQAAAAAVPSFAVTVNVPTGAGQAVKKPA